MARSPPVDSAEWVNPRFRRWRQPRSPLAVANGWINPLLSRLPASSCGRGRIRGGSQRGRGRHTASSRGGGRDPTGSHSRSPQFYRGPLLAVEVEEGPSCTRSHPLPIGEPAGSVGDAFSTGGGAGSEGDVSSDSGSPIMSPEEFQRRYVVTEADKALWERCVAEADREVDAMFPLSDEDHK